jgi:hypothetical protein
VTPRQRAGIGLLIFHLGFAFAASRAVASEQDGDHHGASASAELSQLDLQTAAVARRLWGDLVCVCPRCERLTLSACHCPDAARERNETLELLRGRDLSSPSAADTAYQTVVAAFVARKGKEVLASERPRSGPPGWPALAVSVGLVVLACAAVVVIEHRRRRSPRAARRRR